MSPSPDDPIASTGGARLRARARVQPRLRAEVEDALGGLERSLVEVATWERMQASPLPPPPPPQPERDVPPPPAPVEAPAEVLEEVPPPPPPSANGDIPAEMRVDLDPAVVPHRDGGGPLLINFTPDAVLEQLEAAADGSLLARSTGVAAPLTQADEEAEEARRRHRNGRILSWAGVLILVGVAALWLVPDRSDGDKLPAVDEQTTTTEDPLVLDRADLTTTTEVVTTTTAQVEVTAPSTTVKRSGSSATTKATTTTRPPTTTTTVRKSQPPLVSPGSPTRTVPPSTPTTAAPTTTTEPATTTTAAPPEG